MITLADLIRAANGEDPEEVEIFIADGGDTVEALNVQYDEGEHGKYLYLC